MQGEKVWMVRGPATVNVDGICRLLGMDVSGRTVQVRAGRALPFEPEPRCALDVQGGESWDAALSGAGTAMWASMVQQILRMSGRRLTVMIVGATDTGKSTLSTYLSNMAIAHDFVPCIIDGDIGQGDLAPPGAIGAALVKKQVTDLRDIGASHYEFVGSVTPAGSERLVSGRMKSILARTRRLSGLHIINTDGYVADGGAAYKRMLARVLAPTVIVCLGQDDGLKSTLTRGPWLFLQARSSGQAAKTRLERVEHRMDQFMNHVGGEFVSKDAQKTRFVYRARSASLSRAVRIFAPVSVEGMFVGLGLRGLVRGFGIIIKSLAGEIQIKTSVQDFDTVYLSNIALKGGTEVRLC